MPEDVDKVTVGLTAEGRAALAELMTTGWFRDEVDAYRVAIAVALSKGLVTDESRLKGVETKFNVGTLNRRDEVRQLLSRLVPEVSDRPIEYAERLADAGLRHLATKLVDQDELLSDVLLTTSDDDGAVEEAAAPAG